MFQYQRRHKWKYHWASNNEKGLQTKDHFNSIFFAEDFDVILFHMSNKFAKKKTEDMLNYAMPCSRNQNLRSFWFIIKQQWWIEQNIMFSISAAILIGGSGLSDTIKEYRSQSFRREDLNLIFNKKNISFRDDDRIFFIAMTSTQE